MRFLRILRPALLVVPALLISLACAEPDAGKVPPVAKIAPQDVSIKAEEGKIEFLAGKDLVGRYLIGKDVAKPYMWPINGPGGAVMTRAYPMEKAPDGGSKDHIHHRSMWFCHGDIIPAGVVLKVKAEAKDVEGADFWSEAKGHSKIVCTKVDKAVTDKNHGKITTINEWRTPDDVKLLDEVRTIHLYDFGDTRLLVFDIDLHASVCPLTFGDTKEGAFGIRVNDEIRADLSPNKKKSIPGKGKIEDARGKVGEKECQGRASAWCDYSGPIDGKTVGIAILCGKENIPSCWMARGYGMLAANPFGRDKAEYADAKGKPLTKLGKGEHLKLRYGVLIHPGDAKTGKVGEYYDKFEKLKD